MEETDLDREQFIDLFPPEGFKFETIKQKVDNLLFIHGDNDPFCPLDQAQWLATQTDSEIIIIPDGSHLSQKQGGFTELSQMTDALKARGWM
jgi:predicted alpha/beta hydrolase family esterase